MHLIKDENGNLVQHGHGHTHEHTHEDGMTHTHEHTHGEGHDHGHSHADHACDTAHADPAVKVTVRMRHWLF